MGYGPGGMDMGYGPDGGGMMGGSGMGYGSMYPPAPPMPAGMYGPGGYGGSGMPPITPAPSPPYPGGSMGGSPGDGGSPGMGDGMGDGGSPYGSGRRLSHEGPFLALALPHALAAARLGSSSTSGPHALPAAPRARMGADLMSVLANPAPCEGSHACMRAVFALCARCT